MELVPDPSPPDLRANRALDMIRRAKTPLRVAMGMVVAVVIAVPIAIGVPSLSAAGVGILGVLAFASRAADGRPEDFRRVTHLLYFFALAAVSYAVFGLGLPPVITVYFPAMVLLGAAHILGTRSAIFWSVPSVALVAAGVFFAPASEREVSDIVTFGVRAATLLTILAFAVSFRTAHDRQAAELLRGPPAAAAARPARSRRRPARPASATARRRI